MSSQTNPIEREEILNQLLNQFMYLRDGADKLCYSIEFEAEDEYNVGDTIEILEDLRDSINSTLEDLRGGGR